MIKLLLILITVTTAALSQHFTKAIEDNSYFIEEAYNQEDRVVQHIFNGTSASNGTTVETSFTQEWPLFGRSHQLSITIPYVTQTSPSLHGIGDLLINYRYQAIDQPELAFSPRLSLILPSGDDTRGLGTGASGLQINLPVSSRFSNDLVIHVNGGMTVIPNGAAAGSAKELYSDYFAGGSAIYLVQPKFNMMLEVLFTNSGSNSGRTTEAIISPGVRWAIDIGDLQIVPGIAAPFMFTSGRQSNGLFLYTSFEHFF